ncbi:MAG: hypothetical protein GF411_09835 [Candidatus Lokiarchaeota archaeon]|nr:hypothetical protein [Candidatus Lokiarchaeota archaeon]
MVSIMSESDLKIVFEFENGLSLEGTLDRVLAPLIVEEIKVRLPLTGRGAVMRGELKITLGISKGNIKPVKEVKKGDIAYMPLGDSLCIYLKDMKTFSPVNILGRITSEESLLEEIKSIKRGSRITIKKTV